MSAVLGGMAWLLMSASATAEMEACGDGGDGSQDIESLIASYESEGLDGLPTITVEMTLCADADRKTKYRLRFDHMAPFYDTADRNDDTVVDENDVCVTTSDTGMMHRGKRDNGPGEIEVVDNTIRYTIKMADLDTNLIEGDTIYLWADTQDKGIVDKAPDTDASDGCGKPESDSEVIALLLEEPSEICTTKDRYKDLGDGTVQDCATDLIWLKDASCAALAGTDSSGRANWDTANSAAAALSSGTCGLSDGSQAGDWRLPTIGEFCSTATPTPGPCPQTNASDSLIDSSIGSPAPTVTNTAGDGPWAEGDAFVGVQSGIYWSGTEIISFAAWNVYLDDGLIGDDLKAVDMFVWPVRVGQ